MNPLLTVRRWLAVLLTFTALPTHVHFSKAATPPRAPQVADTDIEIGIVQSADSAPGGEVPFFLTIENSSDISAENVTLTVTLQTNLVFRASDVVPAKNSNGVIVYAIGNLAAHAQSKIRLDTNVSATAAGETQLETFVATSSPEAELDNNVVHMSFALPDADLQLQLSQDASSETFAANSRFVLALDYALGGSANVSGATLALRLPAGTTFLQAALADGTAITPTQSNNAMTFTVGALNVGDAQRLLVQVRLPATLVADQVYTSTAHIQSTRATEYDGDLSNNDDRLVQAAIADEADLQLSPDYWSEGEVGGRAQLNLNIFNSGLRDAPNARLVVTLTKLSQATFSLTPTTRSGDTAIWELGNMTAGSSNLIEVKGVLAAAGTFTLSGAISTTARESVLDNNAFAQADTVAKLNPPVITQPRYGNVSSTPTFFGSSHPNATVSLFLSGTQTVTGRALGSGVADENGNWVISVTAPITMQGWIWFTATQTLNAETSKPTQATNFVGGTAFIDLSSLHRDGDLAHVNSSDMSYFRRNSTHTLSMKIVECSPAYSPTLAIDYFDAAGVRIQTDVFTPTAFVAATGQVTFTFNIIADNDAASARFYVRYGCTLSEDPTGGGAGSGNTGNGSGANNGGAGGGDVNPGGGFGGSRHGGCISGCNPGGDGSGAGADPGPGPGPNPGGSDDGDSNGDDEGGTPPNPQPGGDVPCWVPGSKHKCEPVLIDPDGFVFDEDSVKAGVPVTQSLITTARVTLTVQQPDGSFAIWPAQNFEAQVNPQQTDAHFADKVLTLGYYAFFVPAGEYIVNVSAPGYLPYQSPLLRVIDVPITWHVGMTRAPAKVSSSQRKVFLPFVRKP